MEAGIHDAAAPTAHAQGRSLPCMHQRAGGGDRGAGLLSSAVGCRKAGPRARPPEGARCKAGDVSEPACRCDPADLSCAALMVRQLSQDRVRELADEIWARSTGGRLPANPAPDPRRSRPGASAFAAYRRHRRLERQAWRPGWRWRAAAAFAVAVAAGVLIGRSLGPWLGWWVALPVGLLTGWRLRFRPSAVARAWRRQAGMQRRSAGVLAALERDGYLVLHDVTLPGWPAALDHLVVGSTGVWVIRSWRPSWPAALRNGLSRGRRTLGGAAGTVRGLRGEADAVADALAGASNLPVRALLCTHGWAWPAAGRSVQQVSVATPPRLAATVRSGPRVWPGEVDRAAARALEVLRPAV
jgi:Nuclease-related domain